MQNEGRIVILYSYASYTTVRICMNRHTYVMDMNHKRVTLLGECVFGFINILFRCG